MEFSRIGRSSGNTNVVEQVRHVRNNDERRANTDHLIEVRNGYVCNFDNRVFFLLVMIITIFGAYIILKAL